MASSLSSSLLNTEPTFKVLSFVIHWPFQWFRVDNFEQNGRLTLVEDLAFCRLWETSFLFVHFFFRKETESFKVLLLF